MRVRLKVTLTAARREKKELRRFVLHALLPLFL